jgi:AcrR family transcriptional regulator
MPSTVDRRTLNKLATHRALASAARELTLEQGLDAVTVDDIADAAGVSPRTFFNYFSCKEEAIVGADATVINAAADQVRNRPADEDPFTALLAVLTAGEDAEYARRWKVRAELTAQYPELMPRHLAAIVAFERALTSAVADRLGTDAETDPYPKLIVTSAVAALRSTMEWWLDNGQPIPFRDALGNAFALLASGFARPGPTSGTGTS